MLKFLHIENIAVIEQSDIEFKSGFNVLTGETGAGKSIVIDAINAVLGERTSKDLIRSGRDSALVSAVFGQIDTYTLKILSKYGITPDEDGNIVISQKMYPMYKIRYYESSRSVGWTEVYKKEKKIGKPVRYYNKEIVTVRGVKDVEKAYHCINRLIIESANKTDNRADFSKVLFNI